MRKTFQIVLGCLMLCVSPCFGQQIIGNQQVITLPVDPWATTQALLSLPGNYDSTKTETYPLIVWLHGVGQAGTDISGLLSDQGGIPYRISQGFIPQAINPVDGKLYKFIVVSPQAPSWSYQYQQIQFILPGILAKYRVDTTRIYITGLSAGGNGALTCITDNPTFCGKIAAVSVMSAASITSTEAAAMTNVDVNHLPFWDICGTADPNDFYPPNVAYVNTVWKNNPNPTPDSTWLFNVGHSSWFEGYDPNWKGRSGHSNGLNMYQWFLQWQRGVTIPWGPGVTATAPPPKPTAQTTTNTISMTLPTNSASLNATPSTPPSGGTISSYQWSVLSGPSTYTFSSTSASTTTMTNLVAGTYKTLLTVTSNLGAVAYDTVTITVNPHTPPKAVATASLLSITLPINSVTLSGASSTDADGTITGYKWAYVSGPGNYTLSAATSAQTSLSSLVTGTYVFSLTVTDNAGATSTANVSVLVIAGVAVSTPATTGSGSGSTASSSASSTTGSTSGSTTTTTTTSDPASTCGGKRVVLAQQGDDGITLDGTSLAYQPGDTLVIPATGTNYTWLDFTDIYGTATCPVVMTNGGGQVVATTRFNCANCRYVHMTGTGTTGVQYGFLLQNTSQVSAGIDISGRSSYVEMDHISIHNLDYGIWVKQDQGCIDSLNYPNWTIDHISIHDNRIVGTYDEGMYLGTTDPNGTRILTCNGVQPNPLPKPLYLSNISVYNNYIDSTGRSGIQLSDAETGDNEIYNNIISNSGLQLNEQQGNGISLGGYSQANIHNNVITNSYTMGIFALGAGVIDIYDNTISLSGHLEGGAPQSASIMVDTRPTSPADSTHFTISNNILGTNTDFNIRVYASYPTYAYANVICNNKSASGVASTIAVVSGVHYTNNCTAAPSNISPVARAGGKDTLTLPTSQIQLSGLASTDADGTIATYLWTFVDGPGSPALANASTATPTLSNLKTGIYQYQLTVTDNLGATGADTVTIVVLPAASATATLVAAAGGNATLVQPQDSALLNGTGSYGQDGVTITSYKWTILSGPSGGRISNPTSVDAALANITTAGTYKVILTVTGSNGKTASDTSTITVIADNVIPTAIISNADSALTTGLVLNGSSSYAPPATTLASYQWTQVSGPSTAVFATATSATTGVSGLVAGTYVFQLTVADVQGEPASTTVSITVKTAGTTTPKPPVVNLGSTITLTLPLSTTALHSTVTDPNGSSISTYKWTMISAPAKGYTFDDVTDATAYLGYLVAGTYVVQLKVVDALGLSDSAKVSVVVVPDKPLVVNVGSTITLQLPLSTTALRSTVTDPNGSTITSYTWTMISSPAKGYAFDDVTDATAYLGYLVAGTYVVQLKAKDALGIADSARVSVVVLPYKPLVIDLGSAITLHLPLSTTALRSDVTDPNGSTITSYTWTMISSPAKGYTFDDVRDATAYLGYLVAGTYVVQLKAKDAYGVSDSARISVVVEPVASDASLLNSTDSLETPGNSTFAAGSVRIYPNPVQDNLNVWLGDAISGKALLSIYDISGKLIKTETISKTVEGNYVENINTATLPVGTYVLTVQIGTKRTTLKFIKMQ